MGIILTGSNQAAYTFDLGGALAPRPKNLFFVRFVRAESDGPWKTAGFLVKQIELPQVNVQSETLNQYNKKRIIHTGLTYEPTRIVLHDTADSRMLQMWYNYSSYYFGDFRHSKTRTDWDYDATAPDFKKAGGEFGFAPTDANLFYFSAVEIYQVFRQEYVQWSLINPRITTFAPETLDYSDSDPSTFSMTLAYEAVFYENNGAPASIKSNSWLNEQFGFRNLGGFLNELPDQPSNQSTPSKADPPKDKTSTPTPQKTNQWTMPTPDVMGNYSGAPTVDNSGPTNQAAGALKNQGNYDFGSKQQSADGKANPSAAQKEAAQKSSGVSGSPANSAAKTAAQTNTAPQDHIKNTPSGVALSPAAIAQENKTRPPTSQIGVNGNNTPKPINKDPIYASESKSIQSKADQLAVTSEKVNTKADALGLPQGNLDAKVEGGVITYISRGGKGVDLYPSLSASDKATVDAVRKARAMMGNG
jgi:hypothetical protein